MMQHETFWFVTIWTSDEIIRAIQFTLAIHLAFRTHIAILNMDWCWRLFKHSKCGAQIRINLQQQRTSSTLKECNFECKQKHFFLSFQLKPPIRKEMRLLKKIFRSQRSVFQF